MRLGEFVNIVDGYSGFFPGLAISLVVSLAFGRRVGLMLRTRPILGFALVMALGVALSATVTPSHDALARGLVGTGTCDFTRFGLPTRNQLAWPGEIVLNILLFLPLGFAIGLSPPSRAKLVVLVLAYFLPFAIEVVQLVAIPLGRECQSGDVIDNLTGLTLGIVVATAARWIKTARSETGAAGTRLGAGIAALAGVALLAALLLTPAPTVAPAPTPAPTVVPAPTATPPAGSQVRVSSIPALRDALADDAVTEIVVADGTYRVSAAASQAADSLWIGSRFAGRTRPVTVRAETRGGVTFDGGGTTYFGCISFEDGAHDQTWDGFNCAGGQATDTGVVVFGGYAGLAAPHHITMRYITILASSTGRATSASAPGNDHAISVAQAVGGPHDLLFEDITVDGRGGLAGAIVFYYSTATERNAWNVTVRRLHVTGTQQAIMLWDPTLRDITFDTADITDALSLAVRYESPGATGIVFANITSTGSGSGKGFHSSLGAAPPGVTFSNNSFR